MTSNGSAPGKQLRLSLGQPGGETGTGESREDASVNERDILARALERDNLYAALRQVQRNHGGPGIDGMTVEALPGYLKQHWLAIKAQLLEGSYRPQPVKRVERAKPDGGVRLLGVPCVVDRFIQQALMQVLQADWDGSFSDASFGFRPGRSAHQAVSQTQQYLRQRGVKRELAWNTAKSAHGPWRLSKSPALSQALPTSYFAALKKQSESISSQTSQRSAAQVPTRWTRCRLNMK